MKNNGRICRLNGKVQHYDWGGTDYLPQLLGIKNVVRKPYAEYWMGTHSKAPSDILIGEEPVPLSEETTLSFLLKVLDVRDMLSIQVHPSKKAAEIEFSRENSERIPLDAPHRNYKDDNHKPELAWAISDFWLLHGFKTQDQLLRILRSVPEFEFLLPVFETGGYEGLYKKVMGMPQDDVNACLQPLLDRIVPLYEKGVLHREEEDHWAAKAAITFNRKGQADRGIFSIYFFNVVHLRPGQAIFQDAGIPHAYLFGQCVEIMANSDNVLRGGLTTKHIDVKELLKHTRCEGIVPDILDGEIRGTELVFETPAPDFELRRFLFENSAVVSHRSAADEILLIIAGEIELKDDEQVLRLKQGQSAYISPGTRYEVASLAPDTLVFTASKPIHNG